MRAAGLDDGVQIEIRDYRDVTASYDGIASIEMFEAVGEQYWAGYFALHQAATEAGRPGDDPDDHDRRAPLRGLSQEQRLHPAIHLSGRACCRRSRPSSTAATAAGLRVVDQFAFGQDYARTLAAWLCRFHEREREVATGGFDTAFVRTWSFYLAYCSAAFRFDNTDVVQFTLDTRR